MGLLFSISNPIVLLGVLFLAAIGLILKVSIDAGMFWVGWVVIMAPSIYFSKFYKSKNK